MGPEETGGPDKLGGGVKHDIKSNKRGEGRNKRRGVTNFDKIKRKGLFVNEIQFYH